MLGEAGLAAHDARPRPRQTEARRRHRQADARGQGMGACATAHTSSEAVPGHVRMRLARTARMTLAQRAYVAHDPRRPAPCRITGCQVVRGDEAVRRPKPQDRRAAPEAVDFRRRWRCLSRGDRVERLIIRRAACRSRLASPCFGDVRRFRSRSRRDPYRIRAARRVVWLCY